MTGSDQHFQEFFDDGCKAHLHRTRELCVRLT